MTSSSGCDEGPGVAEAADGDRAKAPSRWVGPGIVLGAFVLSRVAYWVAGGRFLYAHAYAYHQFVDAPLARDALAESLWWNHTQPPGLNLLWGIALKVSTEHPDRVLWPIFLLVGAATALGLRHLATRLGMSASVATAAAVLWTVSPTALLMEWYFLYTPFEPLALVFVGMGLVRWHRTGEAAALIATLGGASAIALTRTSFHLVWVLGVIVCCAWAVRGRARTVALAGLLPLVLVGGWYAKNAVLFGSFGSSSWIGANLARITTEQLPDGERRQLAESGVLSPYAPFPAFASFEDMDLPPTGRTEPGRGVALLDRYERSFAGFANLSQRDYLDVNEARMDDALWVLRHRPGAYGRGLSRSWSLTFGSSSDWLGYGPNRDELSGAVTAERWLEGGWAELAPTGSAELGSWRLGTHVWLVMLAYGGVLVGVPVLLARRRVWRGQVSSENLLAAYLWGSTFYLTVLGASVEFGENSRFRSVTDPLVGLLALWLLRCLWAARPAAAVVDGDGRAAP